MQHHYRAHCTIAQAPAAVAVSTNWHPRVVFADCISTGWNCSLGLRKHVPGTVVRWSAPRSNQMRIKVLAGGVKSNDKSEECAAAIVLFCDNDCHRERTSKSRLQSSASGHSTSTVQCHCVHDRTRKACASAWQAHHRIVILPNNPALHAHKSHSAG